MTRNTSDDNLRWHAPPDTIRAYVAGRLSDPDAWSVEAHLTSCEYCRAAVADVAAGEPAQAADLAHSWRLVADQLPEQGRIRRGSALRGLRVLLASGPAVRRAWVMAAVLVLGISVGFDLAAPSGVFGSDVAILALVAPILPVLGVAVSFGSGLDDASEVIASTPSGGLRLLLARTVAVLAVTVPATFAAGVVTGAGTSAVWLLPCLTLTVLTLALGSVLGVGRAAALLGTGWVLLVSMQLFADDAVQVLTNAATPGWLVSLALAAVAVVVRREAFNQLPSAIRSRSEA